MEFLYCAISWGSPLGLGIFFLLSGAGAGIFFWGFSRFMKSNKDKTK